MELLILLASRQGQLVTRADIAERLWSSEVFVDTEHGINTAVRKLRHLLRDDVGEPKFIQTVTGMGYRFVAPVTTAEPVVAGGGPIRASEVVAVATGAQTRVPEAPAARTRSRRRALGWYAAAGLCALGAFGGTAIYRSRQHSSEVKYTQLTDFTDSAVQPALSPDGRMLAFVRGVDTFMTARSDLRQDAAQWGGAKSHGRQPAEVWAVVFAGWVGDRIHGAGGADVLDVCGVCSGGRAAADVQELGGAELAGSAASSFFAGALGDSSERCELERDAE